MASNVLFFCNMIRERSQENLTAIKRLSVLPVALSPSFSILRQELDSMVRVIYLLSIKDLGDRHRLIEMTLQGEKWKVQTPKGKWRTVTDREMVDLAHHLQGWTQAVYSFGCAFVHLSDFHNHQVVNPLDKLSEREQIAIKHYMAHYHGFHIQNDLDLATISPYIVSIFNKISSNLECYLSQLENELGLENDLGD